MPDKPIDDKNQGLSVRSGGVQLHGKLTDFLYTLMRDHLPTGTVEELVRTVEAEGEPHSSAPIAYSNGWLAHYAHDLAKRLLAAE